MEQQSTDAVARALAFANGLRKNTTTAGRRWTSWPGGANQLARVIALIDGIRSELQSATSAAANPAEAAMAIADLRAVLEWTSYQSTSLATARAVVVARKTRTFAERFGLLETTAPSLATLADSEDALIENVRIKNGYMTALAARHPRLGLPRPLVDADGLARKSIAPAAGKLALIRALTKASRNGTKR